VIFPFCGVCTGPWHGPWKQCPIIHWLYVPWLFFFSDFSDIFSSETSKFPFFGHVPWTLKTSPNNTDHLSYFLIYFIAIFHQEMQMFPYLEMHIGPWLNPPNIITNHPLFFSIFSLFYSYFSFSMATISIFGTMQWTLTTASLLKYRLIEMK